MGHLSYWPLGQCIMIDFKLTGSIFYCDHTVVVLCVFDLFVCRRSLLQCVMLTSHSRRLRRSCQISLSTVNLSILTGTVVSYDLFILFDCLITNDRLVNAMYVAVLTTVGIPSITGHYCIGQSLHGIIQRRCPMLFSHSVRTEARKILTAVPRSDWKKARRTSLYLLAGHSEERPQCGRAGTEQATVEFIGSA